MPIPSRQPFANPDIALTKSFSWRLAASVKGEKFLGHREYNLLRDKTRTLWKLYGYFSLHRKTDYLDPLRSPPTLRVGETETQTK